MHSECPQWLALRARLKRIEWYMVWQHVILLHFTGPPVLMTARMRTPPQRQWQHVAACGSMWQHMCPMILTARGGGGAVPGPTRACGGRVHYGEQEAHIGARRPLAPGERVRGVVGASEAPPCGGGAGRSLPDLLEQGPPQLPAPRVPAVVRDPSSKP
eukprot:1195799-Prorocentrum_minimum.AAC.4